jgi:hypothetical protein
MADDDGQVGKDLDSTDITALRARNEILENNLKDLQDASDRRAIQSELRSEATRRGMVDLDGLKLINLAEIEIDQSGTVHGVPGVMTKLRRDKPWLFGASNSSSVAGVPTHSQTRTKLATEMTLDEWRSARADLLRRG